MPPGPRRGRHRPASSPRLPEALDAGREPIREGRGVESDGPPPPAGEIAFGVEVVGVNQAGEEHPGIQLVFERRRSHAASVRGDRPIGHGLPRERAARPGRFEEPEQPGRLSQRGQVGVFQLRLPMIQVRQARVMAEDCERGAGKGPRQGGGSEDRVPRRLVSRPPALEILLEGRTELAQVVKPPGAPGQVREPGVLRGRRFGEFSGLLGHVAEVIEEQMRPPGGAADVGEGVGQLTGPFIVDPAGARPLPGSRAVSGEVALERFLFGCIA